MWGELIPRPLPLQLLLVTVRSFVTCRDAPRLKVHKWRGVTYSHKVAFNPHDHNLPATAGQCSASKTGRRVEYATLPFVWPSLCYCIL